MAVREREVAIELVDDAVAKLRAAAQELSKIGDTDGVMMLNMLARVVYSVAFKTTPDATPIFERPGPDEE